jgi:hypothetical protein
LWGTLPYCSSKTFRARFTSPLISAEEASQNLLRAHGASALRARQNHRRSQPAWMKSLLQANEVELLQARVPVHMSLSNLVGVFFDRNLQSRTRTRNGTLATQQNGGRVCGTTHRPQPASRTPVAWHPAGRARAEITFGMVEDGAYR